MDNAAVLRGMAAVAIHGHWNAALTAGADALELLAWLDEYTEGTVNWDRVRRHYLYVEPDGTKSFTEIAHEMRAKEGKR